MAFTTRRGRPPAPPRIQTDLGTPELALKRALGFTDEALDRCLARGVIDDEQHRAGLHFRWLYTLRYGAPNVSARSLRLPGDALGREASHEWREDREAEFTEAARRLKAMRAHGAVLRTCVFDEMPRPALRETLTLRGGLAELAAGWKYH